MIAVYNQLKEKVPSAKMLLQVHDELIVECDTRDAELVSKIMKETMENVIKLDVPLKVSVESGTSWGQFH
jgi:DNA polymerase-1